MKPVTDNDFIQLMVGIMKLLADSGIAIKHRHSSLLATSCSPSHVSRKASGNRSAHRMQSNVARRVQAADQDPDRAALGGNRGDVVLGFAGFWSDHDAQGGRLAEPKRKAIRSTIDPAA